MFFKNISADFRRITDLLDKKPWIVKAFYPFSVPGFHALIWYRLIQANRRYRIPVLFYLFAVILRIFNTFTQWFWGICIASNSEIGPGLYIAHHGQIFVGVKTMGANCTIGHNVTIGRTEKEHGYPHVGNNVYMAPGSMIIGYITVGDNVKIGPNAVVRRSVPDNSVVIAPLPRVVRMTSKEEWLKKKDSVNENDAGKTQRKPASETRDSGAQARRTDKGAQTAAAGKDGNREPYRKPHNRSGGSGNGKNYSRKPPYKQRQPQSGKQPQPGNQPRQPVPQSSPRGAEGQAKADGNSRRNRRYHNRDRNRPPSRPPDNLPRPTHTTAEESTGDSPKSNWPRSRMTPRQDDFDGEPLDD